MTISGKSKLIDQLLYEHKKATKALKQGRRVATYIYELNRIIDTIYNWSYQAGQHTKLYEFGGADRAIAFTKALKPFLYTKGVTGSGQIWAEGRVFVNFWDLRRSELGESIDGLATEFELPYSPNYRRQPHPTRNIIKDYDLNAGNTNEMKYRYERYEPVDNREFWDGYQNTIKPPHFSDYV